jgi:uncharacterized protein DUF262/uncharacterized protein DUF1524
MAKIESHKYSIEEAFRECFYIVPDYQREYVWTEKEVQQLLDDVDEQIDGGNSGEYFIGTVLVSPAGQRNHYEVIDGQQRLTTLFLLLCVLKHLFRGEPQVQALSGLISTSFADRAGNTRTSLKLEPRYENAGEVLNKLVEIDADPQALRASLQASGIASFGSLENLLNAYATIYRSLKDTYSDIPSLKKYWGCLANDVIFIQLSTDVSSALKIFETINERGIGLNAMDLLKNLLFTQVRHDQFTLLKDEWKKVTKPLEKEGEKALRFLRYFLMANYKIAGPRNDAVVREDEIYQWFVDEDNAALCDYTNKPFELVRKIVRNVDAYLAFANGCGNDGKPNPAMHSLKLLCGGAFSLHYILLLAASSFAKPLFDHFIGQLESFLFYYIFTKTATKELERNFSLWADDLRSIADLPDPVAQRDGLNAFLMDRFQRSMITKEAELSDALRRYSLYSMQQYRTRYLLAKLTQYVDLSYKGVRTPGSLNEYTVLDIEHILPDHPRDDLRAAFAEANPNADYDECKSRLGNLTLLEKPINIVAGRRFFEAKKPEYKKCKFYLTSSIAELITVGKDSSINRINEKLAPFDDWTAQSIDQRQQLLTTLARDVWKIAPVELE